MNEYAVIGGTGTIGRLITGELAAAGQPVRVLSRHAPDYPVDLTTGEGLEPALSGCEVVVEASNGHPLHPEAVFVDGARRLIEVAARVGVRRIVAVSIVGLEAFPYRYYRDKITQERILNDGPVPTTIVRSTQFHELLAAVLSAAARARISPRLRAPLQPVAAEEAARAVAAVARSPAPPDRLTVAGPEVADAAVFAQQWAAEAGRRLVPVHLPLSPRVGRTVRTGALTCPNADARGQETFASWLRRRS